MPILDVEIVGTDTVANDLARRLADMAGRVFGSPAATTWVRLRLLARQHYAENGTEFPDGWQAVFVTVLKAQRSSGVELDTEAAALATGVAAICQRPVDSVHVIYEPDARDRIAFGGQVRH